VYQFQFQRCSKIANRAGLLKLGIELLNNGYRISIIVKISFVNKEKQRANNSFV